jgi:hypothetical protein
MIDPHELIDTCHKLVALPPSDADIRRAISTAYYALFHTLAASNADLVAGEPSSAMSRHAWERVYRRLEHGMARNNLRAGLNLLSQNGDDFVRIFIETQGHRLQADYDPNAQLNLSLAVNIITRADAAIRSFALLTEEERRFLAAQSMFNSR